MPDPDQWIPPAPPTYEVSIGTYSSDEQIPSAHQPAPLAPAVELLPINNDLLQEYLRHEGYDAALDHGGVSTHFDLEKDIGFRPKLCLIPVRQDSVLNLN